MADEITDQARIAEISVILRGPESVTINGRSVTYNFPALRKERAELRRSISGNPGGFRRVVFKSE